MDPGTRTLGELLQERPWAAMVAAAVQPAPRPQTRTVVALTEPARPACEKLFEPVGSVVVQALPPRLLRLREVQAMVGLARSTIYQMIAAGRFPAGTRVGERARRWPIVEIVAWQDALAR
jgi:prophage regulatory protein